MTDTADDTETESSPPPPAPVNRVNVVALWTSEASRARLQEAVVCNIEEEVERIPIADLVAISTRIPKVRVERIMDTVKELADGPVAVICHAGGEQQAVQLMELGADCIIAEGNEGALGSLIAGAQLQPPTDSEEDERASEPGLVQTFAQKLDQAQAGSSSTRINDPVTGLPTSSAFELRFAEVSQRGQLPRLGFLRLANPRTTIEGLDQETMELLRRRMAMLFVSVTNRFDAELYSLDDTEYAFLARRLSPRRAEEMGEQLIQIAECFSPLGAEPMRYAIGHAGTEVASEPRTLRDLAQRAVEGAVANRGGVVGADDLSRSQASTTELDAALRLARAVDKRDPGGDGHSGRVADYAIEIANELGYEGHELMKLRLTCLLHDIGKVGLPDEALFPRPDGNQKTLRLYREHVERGARYALVSAGRDVSDAILYHHEHWDGSGFPHGLENEDIPIESRILAVADAYDRWTTIGPEPDSGPLGVAQAVERFKELSGVHFDPTVVRATIELFGAGL